MKDIIDVSKKIGNIRIMVNPKTELLGIIMIIGNYKNKYPFLVMEDIKTDYKTEIIENFSKYSNHEVVKMFDELVRKHNLAYHSPIAIFLELDNKLKTNGFSDKIFKRSLHEDKEVYNFIDRLSLFANDIKFVDFYNKNIEEYKKNISEIEEMVNKFDLSKFMIDYYGYDIGQLNINLLAAMGSTGNFGIIGFDGIYSNITKNKKALENGTISFLNSLGGTATLCIHEFGHSYINPLTDEFKLIEESSDMFDEVKEKIGNLPYQMNSSIINEHIVRAMEVRFAYKFGGEERGRKIRDNQYNLGFIYIDNVNESLQYYENNRDLYPTIKEYYPVIIKNIIKEYNINKNKGINN